MEDVGRWHAERETFMIQQLLERLQNRDGARVLLICGRTHMGPLGKRLEGLKWVVGYTDIGVFPWYVEDWVTGFLGI